MINRRKVLSYLLTSTLGSCLNLKLLAQNLGNKYNSIREAQNKPEADPNAGYVYFDSSVIPTFNGYPTHTPSKRFTIINLTGEVLLNGKIAKVGDAIIAGSVVQTMIDSTVVYRFYDEAIRLFPSSRIVHGANPQIWAELFGAMTVAMLPTKDPRTIYIPYSTVQLNGTGIHINTDHHIFGNNGEKVKSEYICTCYGNAIIQRPTNHQNFVRVSAEHHNFPYLSTASNFYAAGIVIGHNDNDLIELANYL